MKAISKFSFLILFLSTLQSCALFKDLEYKGIESYEVENISLSGIKMKFAIKIANPNWFKIKAKGGEVEVKIAGKSLGKFILTDEVVLKKKSDGIVNVNIESKFSSMFSGGMMGIASLFTNGGKVEVQLEGHIKASAFRMNKEVPISTTQTISL